MVVTAEWPVPAADPTDPVSLRVWLAWATDLLGCRGEPSPTRATVRCRPVAVTWAGGTYYRLPKPPGGRGERGGHADARGRFDVATRRERLPGVSVRAYPPQFNHQRDGTTCGSIGRSVSDLNGVR